jgi:hypothetical protein
MEGFICHCHHHNYPNSKDYTCGCNDLLFSEGQMTKAMFHHLQVYIIAMSSSELFQLSMDSS